MKKHEQWSDNGDKTKPRKKNISFGPNVSFSYENRAKNAPASALIVLFIFLALGGVFFSLFSQIQATQQQKEELSLADKTFLAGDYKSAERDYKKLLRELAKQHSPIEDNQARRPFNGSDLKESFTQEKLALTQIARHDYDGAEANLDAALEMHIQFIDSIPKGSRGRLSRPETEAKHVLRILNNKSQLLYLENKKDLVPELLNHTWNRVIQQNHIRKRRDTILRQVVQAQEKSLESRHLEAAAAALDSQLNEIKDLPKEERPDRYLAILKDQRPPANAQFGNCDFGVFSSQ
ncbi:MAG: hypothetical protein WCT03_03040 [Candidatus Obscuribacterales bacterium]|jgi:hypothetical protein